MRITPMGLALGAALGNPALGLLLGQSMPPAPPPPPPPPAVAPRGQRR